MPTDRCLRTSKYKFLQGFIHFIYMFLHILDAIFWFHLNGLFNGTDHLLGLLFWANVVFLYFKSQIIIPVNFFLAKSFIEIFNAIWVFLSVERLINFVEAFINLLFAFVQEGNNFFFQLFNSAIELSMGFFYVVQ